ncbi:MAG: histidine kinase dimerization/phospho-acceptor domain-containing protein, partial [Gammaproteobacteria bacterium]
MHGYQASELLGTHLSIFHTDEQMEQEVLPFNNRVNKLGEYSGEVGHKRKDGSLFPSLMTTTVLTDESKEPLGLVGVARDISELVSIREKAQQANQAKSTFLANMSHDIRTPMNGIIGMTSLALDTELTTEQRKFLKNIKLSAGGLLGLLNDILDFSKIEAGQLLIEKYDFSLPSMLDNIISMMTFAASEKNLALRLQS